MTFNHHEQTDQPEHRFAEYIRILGKGKKGSRPLSQEEAYQAMKIIMADEVLPRAIGCVLDADAGQGRDTRRISGICACHSSNSSTIDTDAVTVDLDWSSYAGKRRQLPWFLLSALLLAKNGVTVLMHGARGASGRLYTGDMLPFLGLEPARSIAHAQEQLVSQRFSYLSLQQFCPKLQEIIELRPILGLRSPVHTLVRLLNPFNAPYSIQGIFHPSYRPVHQLAAQLLNQPHAAVLKGEGGETERNPDGDCLVQSVHAGELSDEIWPAQFVRRHLRLEQLDPEHLAHVWQGTAVDEYGEASVIDSSSHCFKIAG